MRTVLKYKQVGFNKSKTVFFTMLLLAVSFFSGALFERADQFLQQVYAITPEVFDRIKSFFREQMYIKFEAMVGCFKWGSAIALAILQHNLVSLIR